MKWLTDTKLIILFVGFIALVGMFTSGGIEITKTAIAFLGGYLGNELVNKINE